MPMSFPNMDSLIKRAEKRGFREPYNGESEHNYRLAFADFMIPIDFIESHEIRNGVGWDEFNDEQQCGVITGFTGLKLYK